MSNDNHAMDEDDMDDFLYGSDASEENYGITSKSASKKNTEEDEEIYEQYNESLANSASANTDSADKEDTANEKDDDAMDEDQEDQEEDDDEEEDSDDDLVIILEPEENEHATTDSQQLPSQKSQEIPNESTKSPNPLVNIKLGQHGKESAQNSNTTIKTSRAAASSGTATKKSSGGIDLDSVGEYNGQLITDVDLDMFEDKPWRKPGADITDYFNYGFNEMSWRAYCAKQKVMRDNKKVPAITDMDVPDFMPGMDMPDFMKMGMMLPMMEGGMPMGMMNPMMNPMMNLPPPPPSQMGHGQMSGQARGNFQGGTSSVGGGGRTNPSHGGSGGGHGNSRGSRR